MAFIAFRMQQLFYVIVIHRLFLLIISFISGRLLGLRRLLTCRSVLFFPITPRARHFKSVKEKRRIIFGTLLTHADLPLPHTTFPGGVA